MMLAAREVRVGCRFDGSEHVEQFQFERSGAKREEQPHRRDRDVAAVEPSPPWYPSLEVRVVEFDDERARALGAEAVLMHRAGGFHHDAEGLSDGGVAADRLFDSSAKQERDVGAPCACGRRRVPGS
jgi:hypothetical protein